MVEEVLELAPLSALVHGAPGIRSQHARRHLAALIDAVRALHRALQEEHRLLQRAHVRDCSPKDREFGAALKRGGAALASVDLGLLHGE